MSDETFRVERRKMSIHDVEEDLSELTDVKALRESGAVQGSIPQAFLEEVKRHKEAVREEVSQQAPQQAPRPIEQQRPVRPQTNQTVMADGISINDNQVVSILKQLESLKYNYEECTLPSLGKFYDGTDAPMNGIVHVRQMTGEEEEVLAQPRNIKSGKAIDIIFQKCIKEPIQPDKLLGIDRTAILIFLRAISYSPFYEVEIKCPECLKSFSTTIHLHTLPIEPCPDDFNEDSLHDVMPTSGLKFRYRLARGKDESEVQQHREKMNKNYGSQRDDDTQAFRMSLLITEIEGLTNKTAILQIVKRLPINDLNYVRNLVTDPPFGINTEIDLICNSCEAEFQVDLPFESNFFFPRRKKGAPTT